MYIQEPFHIRTCTKIPKNKEQRRAVKADKNLTILGVGHQLGEKKDLHHSYLLYKGEAFSKLVIIAQLKELS